MPMLDLPWSVPYLIPRPGSITLMPATTALPALNPDSTTDTTAYFNALTSTGPAPAPPPPPTPPRVGRPNRGKRASVKASRRAARRSR